MQEVAAEIKNQLVWHISHKYLQETIRTEKKVSENNQQLCKEKNIHYTGRNITINTKHLNSWLLHLNKSGKKIFLNDFSLLLSNIRISNILQWSSTLHSLSGGHYVHMLEDLKTKPVDNMKCIKILVVIHKHNANIILLQI